MFLKRGKTGNRTLGPEVLSGLRFSKPLHYRSATFPRCFEEEAVGFEPTKAVYYPYDFSRIAPQAIRIASMINNISYKL